MYEKTVSECKKLGCLIQNGVQRNVNAIYKNEHDKVREEYGEILKEYVVLKGTNTIVDEFWNVCTKNTIPHLGERKNSVRKKEGAVRQGKKCLKEGCKEGKINIPRK